MVMQESFRHAQRIILKIIGGHPDLSDQLLLLPPTEKKSFSHPAFVSVPYRSISNKYPYLQYPSRSKCRKHLYRYKKSDWIRHYKQSPAFTKRNIQFAVHSRTAEDIIQQIECGTFVVVCIISTATNHYMCLMCVFSYR